MATSVSNSPSYFPERCGICEDKKSDANTLWSNPLSNMAHFECLEKIQEMDIALWNNINIVFHNPNDGFYKKQAHRNAIEIIQRKIGDVSILTYLETQGIEDLAKIFSSREVLKSIRESKNFLQGHSFSHHGKMKIMSPD